MNLDELNKKIELSRKNLEKELNDLKSVVQLFDDQLDELTKSFSLIEDIFSDLDQYSDDEIDELLDTLSQIANNTFDNPKQTNDDEEVPHGSTIQMPNDEISEASKNPTFQKLIRLVSQAVKERNIEGFKTKIFDNFKNIKFYSSCVLPLKYILLHHYHSISIIEFFSTNKSNNDPYSNIYSSRDLYHYICQLPENLVLWILKSISLDNDTFLIIDAYQRKDADAFVNAFESLKDKSSIIEEIVLLAKVINLNTIKNETNLLKNNNLKEINTTMFLMQDIINSSRRLPHLKSTNNVADLWENEWSMKTMLKEYKQVLMDYLSIETKLDYFTKEKANNIFQNPRYRETTEKLIAECKKDIEQGSKNASTINPIAFPDSIAVNKNKRSVFLVKLFDKLEPNYVDSKQRAHFIFLLGGGTDCPEDLIRINWKKEKNRLQAFCRAYLGISENVPWSILDLIFTVKGEEPKLANSSGKKFDQRFFDKIIKEAIMETNESNCSSC